MKQTIIVTVFSLIHIGSFAQQNIIIWSKNVKIVWADFKGKVDKKSSFAAVSAVGIYYKYNLRSNEKCIK